MRSLKKITAIVIAVAMMLSLVSMVSFAAGEPVNLKVVADKAKVKTGAVVTLSVYVEGATNAIGMATWGIPFDTTAFEYVDGSVTSTLGRNTASVDVANKQIKMMSLSGSENVTDTDPVQTVQLKAIKNVDVTEAFDFNFVDYKVCDLDTADYTTTPVKATVSIVPSFAATQVVAYEDAVNVELGTAEADLVLPTTATVADESGAKTEALDVAGEWTSEDYDADAVGVYTFTNTVVADPEGAATFEGSMAVSVTVNVNKIATDVEIEGVADMQIPVVEEEVEGEKVAQEQAAEAVAAAVEEAVGGVVTLKKGDFSEEVEATFVAEAAVTEIGDETVVTVTVAAGEYDYFNLVEDLTTTVTVSVKPATIAYGEVTWELSGNPAPSKNLSVDVTYDEAEYAGKGVVVNVTVTKEDGTTETVQVEATLPVVEEGAEPAADAVATIEIGKLKELFAEAGITIEKGDALAISVEIDGAPVAVEEDSDNADVDFEVKADATGSKPSGVPSVSGGTVPSTKPDTGVPDSGTGDTGVNNDPIQGVPDVDAPAALFDDVADSHWAYAYIKEMKEMGVVSGKTATTFEPDATITRAEFVKMIAVTFGLEIGATESAFEDCGADDWYTPYVVAAAEAGYVNGISETAFGANDAITRQDICTILGRILGLTAEEAEVAFTDVDDIADYALEAVKALAAAGIINGYEDGTFAPTKNASRAEVCKILSSILAAITEEAPEEEADEEEAVVEDVVEDDAAEEEAVVEEETTEEEAAEEAPEEEVVDEK